jgi:hypothetical protein
LGKNKIVKIIEIKDIVKKNKVKDPKKQTMQFKPVLPRRFGLA